MNANMQFLSSFFKKQQSLDPATETLLPMQVKADSPVIRRRLLRQSFLRLLGDHTGETILCLNGILWITQTGNLEDIFLRPGETFTVTQKGNILLQGMRDARLEIAAHN